MTTREETNRGGGIMIFTKGELNVSCNDVELGESNGIEIKIMDNEKKTPYIRIITLYRKPSTNKNEFIKKLKKIINSNKLKWCYQK